MCSAFCGQLLLMCEESICYFTANFEEVGCDKKQAYRFMGCARQYKNEELEKLYDDCVALVGKEANLRAVVRKSKLSFIDDNTVEFDFGRIKSTSLCKNLEGCREAYVFAATVGMGVDRLLIKYKQIDPVKAMVISAVGSSAIECWCDRINSYVSQNKTTKPRFSPGYGGVELRHQREILDFLDGEKRLGITLTDSFFMTPVKSVTAFIGIVEE